MLLAIDPGTQKCGFAIVSDERKVMDKKIIATADFAFEVISIISKYNISTVLVGTSTYGKEIQKKLIELNLKVNIICTPERFSTIEANKRYWKENPPQGLWKLIPTTLRTPPVPLDDYAAVILAERYLNN